MPLVIQQLTVRIEFKIRSSDLKISWLRTTTMGFPGGAVVENLPANAGDASSSPGLGRSHMPWSN